MIVLSRHAGPGDSFLLVHHLLSVYHRRPRIVMKAALQLDPILDVVANRVPNVFINRRDQGEHIYTEQIERLARGLGHDGALVIFPEGGNWTPGRWRRGIQRLEQDGRADLAARAREMPNLLPPRPGGALAAIGARPDADVIFVAHAGLDELVTVGDVWRNLPLDPSSGPGGGASRSTRCPVRRRTRPRSSGCTTGGSGSTPGSPSTARHARRPSPAARRCPTGVPSPCAPIPRDAVPEASPRRGRRARSARSPTARNRPPHRPAPSR